MITSKEDDMCWILELQAHEELESATRIESPVYEITHENVFGVWNLTTLIKKVT